MHVLWQESMIHVSVFDFISIIHVPVYYSASLAQSRGFGNSLRTGCLLMEMCAWK